LKTESGELINDNQQKAGMFNEFFSSVYTDEDLNNMPSVIPTKVIESQLNSLEINEEEVIFLMKKLQTDKSPGPDSIHPRVLEECAEELVELLTVLFQTSFKTGVIVRTGRRKRY
jgi:hypothetical protein